MPLGYMSLLLSVKLQRISSKLIYLSKAQIIMEFSSLEHYMTEVVSNLELRFGPPSTEDKESLTDKRAIEFDVSVERVLLVDFEDLLTKVWMREERDNIFELLILIHAGEAVECPHVSFGIYTHNGYRYPKVVIHGDYLNIRNSSRRLWLNDETVDAIGRDLDANFEYEYVGFHRIQQ